jgi:hypothetical protein
MPLLGIYQKESESAYDRNTCTLMFIAALFIIAKTWSMLRYPSMDEWIEKMWCTYTMEYYSVREKSEVMSFSGKWMVPESIMLSKISQTQKEKYCIFFSHI